MRPQQSQAPFVVHAPLAARPRVEQAPPSPSSDDGSSLRDHSGHSSSTTGVVSMVKSRQTALVAELRKTMGMAPAGTTKNGVATAERRARANDKGGIHAADDETSKQQQTLKTATAPPRIRVEAALEFDEPFERSPVMNSIASTTSVTGNEDADALRKLLGNKRRAARTSGGTNEFSSVSVLYYCCIVCVVVFLFRV